MVDKDDPTKDPEFKRVLGNLLKTPPKRQATMKVGKRTKGRADTARSSIKKRPKVGRVKGDVQ